MVLGFRYLPRSIEDVQVIFIFIDYKGEYLFFIECCYPDSGNGLQVISKEDMNVNWITFSNS